MNCMRSQLEVSIWNKTSYYIAPRDKIILKHNALKLEQLINKSFVCHVGENCVHEQKINTGC